ncbi:hypothetical protein [Lactiplantibacillus pentosus]|uniref:hypothetical protein n=1 Tax=Lactiplantibacillus pentosus TaxID=1589 RepID=UPI001CFFD52B|nr:hypothetical protein [Lactiplantibacillus pentosus]MCB5223199.1 hypothetical protein [Lactiplantibacillus pentosus]
MSQTDKMREFILSYLETQPNQVNLATVRKLIGYGKNNDYSVPNILNELLVMDQKHEAILTAIFDVDFVDGVKLFNNQATRWLTPKGINYLQELKHGSASQPTIQLSTNNKNRAAQKYDGYLAQLISAKATMQTEADQVTLQEFSLDLRHLLTDNKKLECGALNKFSPFVQRNWQELSTPMTPIFMELSRRFLFDKNYDA